MVREANVDRVFCWWGVWYAAEGLGRRVVSYKLVKITLRKERKERKGGEG